MPRPRKCRKVCCLPRAYEFAPVDVQGEQDPIFLTVDEYETIRLIDKEGLSQEECGLRMEVARTTVQQIYTAARKKLALALVDGLPLKIGGGEYRLCQGDEARGCSGCPFRQHKFKTIRSKVKGGIPVIVAIPLDENKTDICPAFARAPFILIHNREIDKDDILKNPAADAQSGAGLKAAQFIVDQGADTLITPRCGENSAAVMKEAEITIYKSDGINARDNLTALKEGKLKELTHFHAGFHGIQ